MNRRRLLTTGLTCLASVLAAGSSLGQLPAFPGAEGAGAFAVGGRNSHNVYVVTNLNDSGPGSLRQGIDSAPQTGRTIVFGVGGTIDLQTDLRIDSPYLTIAGQTAPGAGITLARRALRVNDTHDVILQHFAVRPGDYYTAPNSYEPDSIWISGSSNVIADHISASWSTDEVFSVTHGSTNVTVQWSLITEALHNSNHSKGNHGYGGIIHGGETTLHHNLYANNRSRNPATGNWDKDAPITPAHLEILNNVIANPGDRYSYSGSADQYEVNWRGNFGVEGPNTTRENELFHPDSTGSLVYYADNYYDTQEDGILQLTPAPQSTLTGTYTLLNSPVTTANTPHIDDAPTAYARVLSYAGAAIHRDPIDKRVIKAVVNQAGDHLDSQDEVGGWYYPQQQTQALDPDGLPDWWKTAHGFSASDNSVGHQFASDGYTYLEKYLHYLNAPFLPAAHATEINVSTAFGHGADAQIVEAGSAAGGNGDSVQVSARWTGSSGTSNEMILLRFDLSQVRHGSVADATLNLTAFNDLGNHTLKVYGLDPDAAGQLWDEESVSFDNAPGVQFDGDSGTRSLDLENLLLLGQFSTSGIQEGEQVQFENPDLTVFLNLLSYSDGPDQTVTLLLSRETNSLVTSSFATKEASHLKSGPPGETGEFAPALTLQAVLDLPGDFDGNGIVDDDDLLFWQRGFGTAEDAYTLQGDADDDGDVDGRDFLLWQHYRSLGNNLRAANTQVPEPATYSLLSLLSLAATARPRRGRR